jgi:hypothetical protein
MSEIQMAMLVLAFFAVVGVVIIYLLFTIRCHWCKKRVFDLWKHSLYCKKNPKTYKENKNFATIDFKSQKSYLIPVKWLEIN